MAFNLANHLAPTFKARLAQESDKRVSIAKSIAETTGADPARIAAILRRPTNVSSK